MAYHYNKKCFSLFQEGIHLLAKFGPESSNKSVIRPLVWGSGKAPFSRTMAVQKAKMARLYGRANAGHGARNKRHGAFKVGQGAQACYQWFVLFLSTILCAFKPAIRKFCKAAKEWLSSQSLKWQWLPWYSSIQDQLDCLSRGNTSRSIFLPSSGQAQVVEKQHIKSTCFDFGETWCDSRFSSATKTFHFSMCQKPKRNPNGLGNSAGIPGGAGNKRNPAIRSKTSHPLVCDPKRRKIEVDNRLQGNKSISSAQTVQIGKLERNFSILAKRHVGSKYRSQACLFSLGHCRGAEALPMHSIGKESVSVPSSMLWHEHPARSLAKCDESFPQKMEKGRPPMLDLSGRYFGHRQLPPSSSKTFGHNVARLGTFRHGGKQKEITTHSQSTSGTFGFSGGSPKWNFASAKRKNDSHQKTVGETFNSQGNVHQKDGSHFGSHKSILNGNAFSTSFYRPAGAIRKPAGNPRLGQKIAHTFRFEGPSKGNGLPNGPMERQNFSGKNSREGTSFRFFPGGLGRGGCHLWAYCPGISEGQKRPPHQCERAGSCNKHSEISSSSKGVCHLKSRQFGDFLVLDQRRGQDTQPKPANQTIHKMVLGKGNQSASFASEKFRGFGRWPQQVGQRPWGLHFGSLPLQNTSAQNAKAHKTFSGHVCLPGQSSTQKVCFKVPPLAGHGGRCTQMSPARFQPLLRQPPLESNFQLASQIKGKPPPDMHDGSTLLGFQYMVAPTSQTARQGDTSIFNIPLTGDVHELLARMYASAKVAPSLHDTIRKGLQAKQISDEAAKTYFMGLKSLPRYDSAFRLFWAFCHLKHLSATEASLSQVASMILHFDQVLPSQGRHAYASLLLIPGMEQLQFSPLLRQIKRKWNTSQARYFSFYDASDIICRLALQPLNWTSIPDLRARLLLCLRFFMLCRNVDLERMFRTFSMTGQKPFILIQRKGQIRPQWEAVVQIPSCPAICPWTLLKKYVEMTAKNVPAGAPVFRSFSPPYAPLKANSLGSLTKCALQSFGVDTSVWKAHSTRGAGVTMFKNLGFSSEEVCEIGKWKNVGAFTSHYLRLGASAKVGSRISQMVHKVSPLSSAESDLMFPRPPAPPCLETPALGVGSLNSNLPRRLLACQTAQMPAIITTKAQSTRHSPQSFALRPPRFRPRPPVLFTFLPPRRPAGTRGMAQTC